MPTDAHALADLADLVVQVARQLETRRFVDPLIVPLSPLEGLVLRSVHRAPGISPSRLATSLGLRTSNVSAVLRSLEHQGLVERRPDPRDRRHTLISPTDAARASIDRVRAEWAAVLAPMTAEATDVELRSAVRLLEIVEQRLSDVPA